MIALYISYNVCREWLVMQYSEQWIGNIDCFAIERNTPIPHHRGNFILVFLLASQFVYSRYTRTKHIWLFPWGQLDWETIRNLDGTWMYSGSEVSVWVSSKQNMIARKKIKDYGQKIILWSVYVFLSNCRYTQKHACIYFKSKHGKRHMLPADISTYIAYVTGWGDIYDVGMTYIAHVTPAEVT